MNTQKPPTAPVREVVDSYFGQEIVDPYRWMETPGSQELAEWMRAQNDFTRRYLDSLPLRAELARRLDEVSGAIDMVNRVQRRGDCYFYMKRAAGEDVFKLYIRQGLDGAERVLAHPERWRGESANCAITAYSISPGGDLVTVLVSPQGSEIGDLRVLDAATGEEMGDVVPRTRWYAGEWLPGGQSFAYIRFQELPPGAPPTETYLKSSVFEHRLSSPAEVDRPLFGYGVDPSIDLDPQLISIPIIQVGAKYAFICVSSGVSPNSIYYMAPVDALAENPIPWKKVVDLEDEVAFLQSHGEDLYLLTYHAAPRYKLIRTTAANPDPSSAELVLPEGEAVLDIFAAARDALYMQTLYGGQRALLRMPYGGMAEPVELPQGGSAELEFASLEEDGALFFTSYWTKPPTLNAYDPGSRRATDTGLVPPLPFEIADMETRLARVESYDGTRVPLVILSHAGLARDGSNPALLIGYGAYGMTLTSPTFMAPWLPWLERGGVLAIAGVRGGGEFGKEWHLAGRKATKPNTWKDFIACAGYLVRERYTNPKRLAGRGGSAGGITIGNAITERPDLFAAALIEVGLSNVLRFETTANGVPNIPEFGSAQTEDGFRSLLAMDAYHKVQDGTTYPAVMLTHGANDPRVEPWLSAKMAARLQAASSSGKPVLLRIDYSGGHGMMVAVTRGQVVEENADKQAFLFAQLCGE